MLFGIWVLLIAMGVASLRLQARVMRLERRVALLEPQAVPEQSHVAEAMPSEPEPAAATATIIGSPPGVEVETELARANTPVEALPVPDPKPVRTRRTLGFEDIFGRYLPIWAGGITLIVAGVLIVRYSIEVGLLSPLVRVIAGLIFGFVLIAGAEVVRRARDPRIAQSLSGAGLAVLYVSILIAANLYHLVAPGIAFVGLAGVTVLAGGLSLRFGAPSAVLGLVGGLAAPAMVGASQPDIPMLAAYLAAIVGGLCTLGRSRGWWWLGGLAIGGGFLWSLLLIAAGLVSPAETLAAGGLVMLLAIGLPLLLSGGASRTLRIAAALAGCGQIAALVATGDFVGLNWALFGLLAAAMAWLSRREATLADAPLASAVVGAGLAFAWPAPTQEMLALVLAAGGLIHAVPALWRLWREEGRLSDAGVIALVAFAAPFIPFYHFGRQMGDWAFAALALSGAMLAGGAAVPGWRNARRRADARFATLSLSAIVLLLAATAWPAPVSAFAPEAAIAAVAALLLAVRAGDRRIETGGQVLALVALLCLPLLSGADELLRAAGIGPGALSLAGAARWWMVALAAFAFARWSGAQIARRIGAGVAVVLLYVAAAQIVPLAGLALIPVVMLAGLGWVPLRHEARTVPLAVAGLIAAGWAALPLAEWLAAGMAAVAGQPLYVGDLPLPGDALIRLAAPAAALPLPCCCCTGADGCRRYGEASRRGWV
ncbi:MAG: DUF2339 domain-containing protein [Gemmobacter sp.]|jgi:uncharacterized membrane protein|nr:DUF2339 domain-containing protein [Gemmobacter sp.]